MTLTGLQVRVFLMQKSSKKELLRNMIFSFSYVHLIMGFFSMQNKYEIF